MPAGGASAAVLHSAPVGVELVARDETGPNAARHRPKLALADQGANVLLGAAELESDVSNCQAIRLLHAEVLRETASAPSPTGEFPDHQTVRVGPAEPVSQMTQAKGRSSRVRGVDSPGAVIARGGRDERSERSTRAGDRVLERWRPRCLGLALCRGCSLRGARRSANSGLSDLKEQYFDALVSAAPDRSSRDIILYADGEYVVEQARYVGTHTGPLAQSGRS